MGNNSLGLLNLFNVNISVLSGCPWLLPHHFSSVCTPSWMDTTGSIVWAVWKAEIANLGRRKKGEGVEEQRQVPQVPVYCHWKTALPETPALPPSDAPGTKAIKRTVFRWQRWKRGCSISEHTGILIISEVGYPLCHRAWTSPHILIFLLRTPVQTLLYKTEVISLQSATVIPTKCLVTTRTNMWEQIWEQIYESKYDTGKTMPVWPPRFSAVHSQSPQACQESSPLSLQHLFGSSIYAAQLLSQAEMWYTSLLLFLACKPGVVGN